MLLTPPSSVGFCHNLLAPTWSLAWATRALAAWTSGFIRVSQETNAAGSASNVAIGAAGPGAVGDGCNGGGVGDCATGCSAQADRPSRMQKAATKIGDGARIRAGAGRRDIEPEALWPASKHSACQRPLGTSSGTFQTGCWYGPPAIHVEGSLARPCITHARPRRRFDQRLQQW